MKAKTSNEPVENPIDPAAEETRNESVRAALEPITRAAERVRIEATALADVREKYETRLGRVRAEKAALEQRISELKPYVKDVDSDVVSLASELENSEKGLKFHDVRIADIEAEKPNDSARQEAWQNVEAHFYELRGRIRCYHRNLAEQALAQIAYIRGDFSIFFKSEPLHRADALTIGIPDGLNHVAIAERAIADLQTALGEVDLTQLDSYQDPVVRAQLEAAEASAREAAEASARRAEHGKMRQRRLTPEPEPGAKSSLVYPTDHADFPMAVREQEAVERNAKQLAEWQAAGTAPRTAGPLGGQVVQKQ